MRAVSDANETLACLGKYVGSWLLVEGILIKVEASPRLHKGIQWKGAESMLIGAALQGSCIFPDYVLSLGKVRIN